MGLIFYEIKQIVTILNGSHEQLQRMLNYLCGDIGDDLFITEAIRAKSDASIT
jgi:hypothetical protein